MATTNSAHARGGAPVPPRTAGGETEIDGGVVNGVSDAARSLSFAAPLHPILVHYTIALTSASLLFELLGRLTDAPELRATGWWTLALSVAATVLTLVTGTASRRSFDIGEGTARSYLRLHMALGPTFFGMLVGMGVWRGLLWRAGERPGWWYVAALAATAGVMAIQGYAGGELVYRWGAAVEGRARGLRQQRAPERPPRWPTAAHRGPEGERR